MAKQTSTQTYRVSDEVDAELRRLAKIHGGIDRALRWLLNSPDAEFPPLSINDAVRREREDRQTRELAGTKPVARELVTDLDAVGPSLSSGRGKASTETVTRGMREKGDGKR